MTEDQSSSVNDSLRTKQASSFRTGLVLICVGLIFFGSVCYGIRDNVIYLSVQQDQVNLITYTTFVARRIAQERGFHIYPEKAKLTAEGSALAVSRGFVTLERVKTPNVQRMLLPAAQPPVAGKRFWSWNAYQNRTIYRYRMTEEDGLLIVDCKPPLLQFGKFSLPLLRFQFKKPKQNGKFIFFQCLERDKQDEAWSLSPEVFICPAVATTLKLSEEEKQLSHYLARLCFTQYTQIRPFTKSYELDLTVLEKIGLRQGLNLKSQIQRYQLDLQELPGPKLRIKIVDRKSELRSLVLTLDERGRSTLTELND